MQKIFLLVLFVVSSATPSSIPRFRGCHVATGDCPNENVTFWLYADESRDNPMQLDPLKPNGENFTATIPVKILIHGFKGHRNSTPNNNIRPALLDNDEVYVISVDYGPLALDPCYGETVLNVPLVAKCLGQLINNMIEQGVVKNDQIHLIGHSIGAHVAGVAANFVEKRLHRITGLDPSKPSFVNVNFRNCLDADDADFVDVIHTNPRERGLIRPSGHIDFYPNFREFDQPGCEKERHPGECAHNRATEFYAESINSTLGFWGIRCDSTPHSFGRCTTHSNREALMGYHVSTSLHGHYFLDTSNTSPFALGHDGARISNMTKHHFKYTAHQPLHHLEMRLEKQYLDREIAKRNKH